MGSSPYPPPASSTVPGLLKLASQTWDGEQTIVNTSGPQLNLQYSDSDYATLSVANSGTLTLSTVGASPGITLSPGGIGPVVVNSGVISGSGGGSGLSVNLNSLTSGIGVYIPSSSLTTGRLVELAPPAGTIALYLVNGYQINNSPNIGATSTDALVLQNANAATSGTPQQFSGRLRMTGYALNSSSSTSQEADWIVENQPQTVAGTITSNLVFSYQIAGGGYNPACIFTSSSWAGGTSSPGFRIHSNYLGITYEFAIDNGGSLDLSVNGTQNYVFNAGSLYLLQNSAFYSLRSANTNIASPSNGVLTINTGTIGNWGSLKCGTNDASTTSVTTGLILGHQMSGTNNGGVGCGTGILFNCADSTAYSSGTQDQAQGQISTSWTTATHSGPVSQMAFAVINGTANTLTTVMTLSAIGQLTTTSINLGAVSTSSVFSQSSTGSGSTTMYIGNSTINVTAPSDAATKTNVRPTVLGLAEVMRLRVCDFDYLPKYGPKGRTGMVAQEVEKALPGLVTMRSDKLKSIDWQQMVPVLVRAIQELAEKVAA